jgi:hypothetical protein
MILTGLLHFPFQINLQSMGSLNPNLATDNQEFFSFSMSISVPADITLRT